MHGVSFGLTLERLKVNDMDTDLSHLPFWARVKSTASWMRALLWTKEKPRLLTVFFGFYMNSDLTRKPLIQLIGLCPSLDLV